MIFRLLSRTTQVLLIQGTVLQQKKAASLTKSSSMGWLIKWALYLRHQSSKAYELLRESKCISLPSQRKKYGRVFWRCWSIEVAKVQSLKEFQKCVPHRICESVNNLSSLLKSLQSAHKCASCTVYALFALFAVCLQKLHFPYAQFPTSSLTLLRLSVHLRRVYAPFWEAVKRLERCDLKVVAATADGAKPNRGLSYKDEKRLLFWSSTFQNSSQLFWKQKAASNNSPYNYNYIQTLI